MSYSIFLLSGMIHIANEQLTSDRVRIGECVVVLSAREVYAPAARRPRRLTPKAMGVLQVLLRNPGAVVTRDELLADVWPDTLPTNDVLTQAITQLRKAFATDAGEKADMSYIETIAKTGYRLLASVELESNPEVPAVDSDSSVQAQVADVAAKVAVDAQLAFNGKSVVRRRIRRGLLWALGAILLLSCVLMAMQLQREPTSVSAMDGVIEDGTRVVGSPVRPYRLITVTDGFETYPAISPDGRYVVYASEKDGRSALMLQTTGSYAAPRSLLNVPDGYSDRFATWSPDGREIAFARFGPDAACEVLIASPAGGNTRRAASCDGTDMLSFDWTPDGGGLLFGSMTGASAGQSIRRLDLKSGRWHDLAYEVGSNDFDYAPRYSPDGQWIAFVRNPQVGDLWVMPASGGSARRLTDEAAEIRGWSWTADSQDIVFGRRVDSESRLYRLNVRTRTLQDLGLDDAQSPSIARNGGTLTFVHRRPQFGLFRIGTSDGVTKRLYPSSGRDSQPMVSPDGTQLVFTSDRSGVYGLWWAELGEEDSLRLIDGLRPETRQPPDWAPDNSHLLVTGRDATGLAGIYEVEPRSGRWVRLPVPVKQPLQALYADAPDRLFVVERDGSAEGRMVLSLFDRSVTPWRRLAAVEGVSQARYDRAGGRVLFTRLAQGGLWEVDLALSQTSIRQISDDWPTRWRYRMWTVTGDGAIEYVHISADCTTRMSRLQSKASSYCLAQEQHSSGNGFSASSDGTSIYAALAVADGTDIALMELPATPSPLVGAISKSMFFIRKKPS